MNSTGPSMFTIVVCLFLVVVYIAAFWRVYEKAGQPGWAALIPIYNLYIMLKIAGKPGWWLLLCLIPIVNFIVIILLYVALAENFGKSVGFAMGLIFLSFIFVPILAWGDAVYNPKPTP